MSVTALGENQLTQMGISSFVDIKPGTIAGVNFQPFSGTEGLIMIQMRGVSISDGVQGTFETPVPIYVDGVFLGRTQGASLDRPDQSSLNFEPQPSAG